VPFCIPRLNIKILGILKAMLRSLTKTLLISSLFLITLSFTNTFVLAAEDDPVCASCASNPTGGPCDAPGTCGYGGCGTMGYCDGTLDPTPGRGVCISGCHEMCNTCGPEASVGGCGGGTNGCGPLERCISIEGSVYACVGDETCEVTCEPGTCGDCGTGYVCNETGDGCVTSEPGRCGRPDEGKCSAEGQCGDSSGFTDCSFGQECVSGLCVAKECTPKFNLNNADESGYEYTYEAEAEEEESGEVASYMTLIKALNSILIPFGIILSIIHMIIGGYKVKLSQGDPTKVQEGKEQYISAMSGGFFILLSLVILKVLLNSLF
jgi:hypothetical protein